MLNTDALVTRHVPGDSPGSSPSAVAARLKTPGAYQSDASHLFPSESSVRWCIRQHRAELLKAKALVVVNGRVYLDPQPFEAVIIDAGQRALLAPA